MGGRIDHFCGLLRQKLVLTESDLFRLRAMTNVNAPNVDPNAQVRRAAHGGSPIRPESRARNAQSPSSTKPLAIDP